MFDTCKTLAELNKQRLDLIRDGSESVLQINREYSRVKHLIVSAKPSYKQFEIYRASDTKLEPFMTFPIKSTGNSTSISFDGEGFVL